MLRFLLYFYAFSTLSVAFAPAISFSVNSFLEKVVHVIETFVWLIDMPGWCC